MGEFLTTFYIENWKKIDKIDKIKYKIKTVKYLENTVFSYGRGRRIRTLTGGFGDRCATINTIPL